MNNPTNNVVSPHLVKVAKRLGKQLPRAVFNRGIDLVGPDAALLDLRTQGCDDGALLDLWVVVVDARADGCPKSQAGDPRVVTQDCALGIEAPEGDLRERLAGRWMSGG